MIESTPNDLHPCTRQQGLSLDKLRWLSKIHKCSMTKQLEHLIDLSERGGSEENSKRPEYDPSTKRLIAPVHAAMRPAAKRRFQCAGSLIVLTGSTAASCFGSTLDGFTAGRAVSIFGGSFGNGRNL
jgi:hypothetical protein